MYWRMLSLDLGVLLTTASCPNFGVREISYEKSILDGLRKMGKVFLAADKWGKKNIGSAGN